LATITPRSPILTEMFSTSNDTASLVSVALAIDPADARTIAARSDRVTLAVLMMLGSDAK
jgi:hypothetical protein